MIRCVIFDLDGVLVHTDELHFRAWKQIADAEGVPFTRADNERLRGVDRMQSLEILLERATRSYASERKSALAAQKNEIYRNSLSRLSPADLTTGARSLLRSLRRSGMSVAVASSSRNAPLLIERLRIGSLLDAIADGNDQVESKPAPDLFLLAAQRVGVAPASCLVVEDARSGVEAARAAGMAIFGIGSNASLPGVDRLAPDLRRITPDDLLSMA